MDVVALKTEVHDHLVDCLVFLVFAFQVVVHDLVGLGLRVGHHQCAGDGEGQFCWSQPGILRKLLTELHFTLASSSSSSFTTFTSLTWAGSGLFPPFF